jgi:cytochrome P450
VDETLRYDPSVPVWRRVTTQPVTLGGVDLPEGAKLFLWLAAAGRDPAVFDGPDTFDVERENARRHLAFGKGIHFCLGSALGKLEAQLALEQLTRRYPQSAPRSGPGTRVPPEHLVPRSAAALGDDEPGPHPRRVMSDHPRAEHDRFR